MTDSLPGHTTGPLGSAATLACNLGSVAVAAAGLTCVLLPIPGGQICIVLNHLAESADALLNGDVTPENRPPGDLEPHGVENRPPEGLEPHGVHDQRWPRPNVSGSTGCCAFGSPDTTSR